MFFFMDLNLEQISLQAGRNMGSALGLLTRPIQGDLSLQLLSLTGGIQMKITNDSKQHIPHPYLH